MVGPNGTPLAKNRGTGRMKHDGTHSNGGLIAGASPTLEDVARLAGVSTATVSRCLNTPERVVEKTRKRVLKVVDKIGYSPNFSARALAAKRTNTIGAIIPTMENAIFARGLQAFQEALGEEGYTLLVASSSYLPELEEQQIRNLLARGADALLLIGFQRDPSVYRFLESRKVPIVISWAYREGMKLPSVGFDNRRAMNVLARQVFDFGHTRTAIISAPRADNDRAEDRVLGVLDVANERGLRTDTIPIIETPYSIENGTKAMRILMDRDDRPTVVFCGNDVLAVGALQAARALGLRVPEDVSITGFDNIELAAIVQPSITTVHVPHRMMGRESARKIIAMLRGEDVEELTALDTRIAHRASLGPAPGKK